MPFERRLAEAASHLDAVDQLLRDTRDNLTQERNRYVKLMQRKPVRKALASFNFATSVAQINGR